MNILYSDFKEGLISKKEFIRSMILVYPEINFLDVVNSDIKNISLDELIQENMSKENVIMAIVILLNI